MNSLHFKKLGNRNRDWLDYYIQKAEAWILEKPEFREVYAPDGHVARPGDIIKRPTLANTLEIIANEGPDAFYTVRKKKSCNSSDNELT